MSNVYIQGNTGEWEYVIGLEVHAQIKSKTKLFSQASSQALSDNASEDDSDQVFSNNIAEPNQNVDIVDYAMPGTLPVLNIECVRKAIIAGIVLNGEIARTSVFDRKNYFYPDLPKGYQISQFYKPIVKNGYLDIQAGSANKRIRIDRAHIEEDAGKSIHDKHPNYTLVDLNRAGIGLLEIVSMPDISSPEEAVEYAKLLRQTLMHADVNDGNLEEGSFRCDANVSVRRKGDAKLGTRREIKNLNSFSALLKAIEYEGQYQVQTLESGGVIEQSTLLFDVDTNQTRVMRSKEDANDYRYFPDPDLPPLVLSEEFIQDIVSTAPESFVNKKQRYAGFGISEYDINILTADIQTPKFYEAVIEQISSPKLAANWIITELFAALKKTNNQIGDGRFEPRHLIGIIRMLEKEEISGKIAKEIFKHCYETLEDPEEFAKAHGMMQISDPAQIEDLVREVLSTNPDNVAAYKAGSNKVFGFLVGEVLKKSGGKAKPKAVNEILQSLLSAE